MIATCRPKGRERKKKPVKAESVEDIAVKDDDDQENGEAACSNEREFYDHEADINQTSDQGIMLSAFHNDS